MIGAVVLAVVICLFLAALIHVFVQRVAARAFVLRELEKEGELTAAHLPVMNAHGLLHSLEREGLVRSRAVIPDLDAYLHRGSKPRYFYSLTAAGRAALGSRT